MDAVRGKLTSEADRLDVFELFLLLLGFPFMAVGAFSEDAAEVCRRQRHSGDKGATRWRVAGRRGSRSRRSGKREKVPVGARP